MPEKIGHVVVVGDAIYAAGIVEAIRNSDYASSVDQASLEGLDLTTDLKEIDMFVVCPNGNSVKADALIRKLLRRNRRARIIIMNDAKWEERLDYISDRRIGACVSLSLARDELLNVLRLVIAGFSVL